MTDTGRCAPPNLETLGADYYAPGHPGAVYWSTFCMHGLPELCRSLCKVCHQPCGCPCHGGETEPYPGFSIAEEDRLRQIARDIAAGLGIAPGTRGTELIADIATGMITRLRVEQNAAGPRSQEET